MILTVVAIVGYSSWMMARFQWRPVQFPYLWIYHRLACSESLRSARQSQNCLWFKTESSLPQTKAETIRNTNISWHTPGPTTQQTSRNHDNNPPLLWPITNFSRDKWRRLIGCWPAWPSSLQRPSPLRPDKCARWCHPCWYGAHHSWAAPGRRCLERSPRHWRRMPWVFGVVLMLVVSSCLGKLGKIGTGTCRIMPDDVNISYTKHKATD